MQRYIVFALRMRRFSCVSDVIYRVAVSLPFFSEPSQCFLLVCGGDQSDVRERKFVIDTRAKMLGAAFAGSIAGMLLGW